jgi:hypothetical protein
MALPIKGVALPAFLFQSYCPGSRPAGRLGAVRRRAWRLDDRIRPAGALICPAKVPSMFAALRQSKESREFLGFVPSEKSFTLKKSKVKLCTMSPSFLLKISIVEI